MGFYLLIVLLIALNRKVANAELLDEEAAEKLLTFYNSKSGDLCHRMHIAVWNYYTNITPENQQLMSNAELQYTKFQTEIVENFTQFDWQNFTNDITRQQFELMTAPEPVTLSDHIMQKNISIMEEIYSTTKICKFNDTAKCNLNLDPEINDLMRESNNYDELLDAWNQWHTKVGRAIKPYYSEFALLKIFENNIQGPKVFGNMSRFEDFLKDIKPLWNQLKPFYLQIHAYMRRQLVKLYGEAYVSSTGPIPVHLLGHILASDWSSLYNLTRPFQSTCESDVTTEMKEQNYTVDRMFRMAEDFFTSLGLEPMNEGFWNNSMFERPNDGREVVCHASAFDMCDIHDFRIKMCARVHHKDLMTIYHEMGHVQYAQQYRNQPFIYRKQASSGFDEAIGNAIAMSAFSRKHLAKFNLSDCNHDTTESDINFLYRQALENFVDVPNMYIVDYWRMQVLEGYIPESMWNEEWWKIIREYQGIEPTVKRSPKDFDAAALYHIPADSSYQRYFEAYILQFQIHKALCEIAGEYNSSDPTRPLHHCDIYNSTEAGEMFSKVMKLGSSKPWTEVLQMFVGNDKMDASPLIEYFQPLIDYLVKDNEKNGAKIGWK